MSSTLAILGGKPIRKKAFPFPPFPVIDQKETKAIIATLKEGTLSGFVGAPGPAFQGGSRVKAFELAFAKMVGIKYALAVNSATAALHCSVVAVGVGFGDEVIVTPWSFTASAVAALMASAIPVFADVNPQNFCLDPKSIEKAITKYTKAIIIVHLFGRPAPMDEIMTIAKKHHLAVIEDAAQAPLATYKGKKVGTIGDLGVFSFTASKQMTTGGEGGMVITNNPKLAQRVSWMRNHGEVQGELHTKEEMVGILGYNYRMTEINAAIGLVQLKKLPLWLQKRRTYAKYLIEHLEDIPFLEFPKEGKNWTNSYFVFPIRFNQEKAGVHRNVFAKALEAEGIPTPIGYVKPLYWNPIYRWQEFYGSSGFPYSAHLRKIVYPRGLCPVVEKLHKDIVLSTSWIHPKLTKDDLIDIVKAVRKLASRMEDLKKVKVEL